MPATPPFRADHVGSLLRPDAVHAARKKWHAEVLGPDGFTTSGELEATEDRAIAEVVQLQESIGLKAVTDGEFRRSFWHYDFMGALKGLTLVERDEGVQFHGKTLRPIHPTITGRIEFPDAHPMIDHFRYLASVTTVTPKISIPGPSACHYRTSPLDIQPPEYKDVEVLFQDLTRAYAKAVQAFTRPDAGTCRWTISSSLTCVNPPSASRSVRRDSTPTG